MNENLEKAKKLFFDYCCNHFYMAHDGEDIEYKKWGVTQELETAWRKEFIEYWTAQLSLDDVEAVNKLHHAHATEALPDLIRMCDQAEGYAKLWYANTIWDLAGSRQAIETCISAWKSLEQGTFTIPEHFEKIIRRSLCSIDGTPEGYIINYAKSKLEEARKQGHL